MKKILTTGSNGLLGQKITEHVLKHQDFELIATSKGANRFPKTEGYAYEAMDVTNLEAIRKVLAKHLPDVIIHTAAMTNVDTCHVQRAEAYQLNVVATQNLISLCEEFNIHFIHLSTDFVFDGADGPYREDATPNPVSYYGETKLLAEQIVQQAKCKWAIVRTILVYGITNDMSRSNIVLWAKGALEKKQVINVVNDQIRTPTLAEDLATGCLLIAEKEAQGIYHISGKDVMTIVDVVKAVARFYNLDASLINEVSSATLNQEAKRPVKTGFILDKAMTELNYQPHSFEEGIAIMNAQLAD